VGPRDVPDPVGLPFALLRTEGALKLRFFAALVRQVSLEGVLPNVTATALLACEMTANPITRRGRFPFRFFIVVRPHEPGV
jgi:hypothetical protein